MQVKSFKGNSLSELDKEVNMFLRENKGKVIDFQAIVSGGSVQKMVYIYIVEFEETIDYSEE